ncbi:MAG: 2-dehydropantoate 2-reductase [SAR324 cluster bacterium]|nr:2-dehydropantoate 2-reductase [SAR324 cluster bacterium]
MKIVVVGTGAMGSVYAGLLADAGNEIWAIDLWQEHLDAIRKNGLRVEGFSGDRTVRGIQVSTNVADAGECDLVIIATKASGVESAAKAVAPTLTPDTPVLTMQNGLGAGERLAKYLPVGNILIGVAGGFGASVKAPGHAHHNGMALIRIGEMTGGASERATRIAEVWRQAGFNTQEYDNIDQLVWEKFVCNVSFSGPCTVFRRTIGEMMQDPELRNISFTCGLEAHAAGVAKGVPFSFDDPVAYITKFAEGMPGARPSMLLDHLAERPSEIDFINGMVPVVAKEVGTAAPYNEVIRAVVRAREAEF